MYRRTPFGAAVKMAERDLAERGSAIHATATPEHNILAVSLVIRTS